MTSSMLVQPSSLKSVASAEFIRLPVRLTDTHSPRIFDVMRATLSIDNDLLERARKVTGIRGKNALVHAGLNALIERESARRLAEIGGTERALTRIRRRRTPTGR